jgi:transcriptional regulator with GAF, ATPase, and Fis domain
MQRYRWPGNVRELENCVERAVVLTRGEQIDKDDLPPTVVSASKADVALFSGHRQAADLKEALAEPERRIIQAALEANNWNRQKHGPGARRQSHDALQKDETLRPRQATRRQRRLTRAAVDKCASLPTPLPKTGSVRYTNAIGDCAA